MRERARVWSAEEDERLEQMVLVGLDYRIIARRLKRSVFACRLRASGRGLKKDPAAVLENRQRGRERFNRSATKVERRRKRLAKRFTPEARMILAEECRARNLAGLLGVREHSWETRNKISAALTGRRFSEEHRRKISEARKRYWDTWKGGGISLSAYRAAMADSRNTFTNEEEINEPSVTWCGQCERRVRPDEATACQSRFCKAKQAMAA